MEWIGKGSMHSGNSKVWTKGAAGMIGKGMIGKGMGVVGKGKGIIDKRLDKIDKMDESGLDAGAEIEKIKHRLDDDETVVKYARQSRVGMSMSNLHSPSSIFVTEKRVIIRLPTRMGMGENIEEYLYHQITNIRLEKGMRYSGLVLSVQGMTEISKFARGSSRADTAGVMDALQKDVAEDIFNYIRKKIDEAREQERKGNAPSDGVADPMKILKGRFAKGEISKEEFEEMKKILE